jgi:integrase/recombinase XerD
MKGPRNNTPPKRTRKKALQPVGDPDDSRGFWHLMQKHVKWLAVHNYSEYTIETRQVYIRAFLVWADARGLKYPTEVTKPILEAFQQHLFHYRKANGDPLSWSSQSKHLIDVRMFFEYLAKENHIPFNPASSLQLPKQPQKLPKAILTADEVERVLAQPDVTTPLGLRDRAIFETLYSTGIRRIEVVRLNIDDLDVERRILAVREGKNQKDRFVPIGTRALIWIAHYVERARDQLSINLRERALFITAHGERLNPDSLTNYGRAYIEAAGIEKPGSCHLFRHSMATAMLNNGASIRYLQALLGHSSISTTQIYTRVSLKKLLEIHGKTHPAEKPDESEPKDKPKEGGTPSTEEGQQQPPASEPPESDAPGSDIDSWLDDE